MGNYDGFLSLTAVFILFYLTCYQLFKCGNGSGYSRRILNNNSRWNEINDFIYDLKYNPVELLTYKQKSVLKKIIENITDQKGAFFVINRQQKIIINENADLSVTVNNEKRVYPGSILLANSRLINNDPEYLPIERSILTYTINLQGQAKQYAFNIIPDFDKYKENLNKILTEWLKNFSREKQVDALLLSDHSLAYSKEQLRTKFGLELRNSVIESKIDFSAVDKEEKFIMIHRFRQIFYEVSVDPPIEPADLFSSQVTKLDLNRKCNDSNPPVMVNVISYGIVIYLKIETTSVNSEAKYILEYNMTNFDVESNYEEYINSKLENLDLEMYVLLRDMEDVKIINPRRLIDIFYTIIEYGNFNTENLGYPIFYSCIFLQDVSKANVRLEALYTKIVIKNEYRKGVIELCHTGNYVAEWKVMWSTFSFDENGQKQISLEGWSENWKSTYKNVTKFELPGNTENIEVSAYSATGLIWDWWRKIFERKNLSLLSKRKFWILGEPLSPYYYIDPDIKNDSM